MNLVYFLEGDDVRSRPASAEELKAARDAAQAKIDKNPTDWAVRSCWVCNPVHNHFLQTSDGFLFNCAMGCGHWFYQGVDITSGTDIATEDEEEA